ncbi:RAB3A interacting protein [Phlyctochytrium planicorne]|nr:RAB3A interacting protein [Phlyctochytrium planicorne]
MECGLQEGTLPEDALLEHPTSALSPSPPPPSEIKTAADQLDPKKVPVQLTDFDRKHAFSPSSPSSNVATEPFSSPLSDQSKDLDILDLVDEKEPDPSCPCRLEEAAVCASCHGLIAPIFRIQEDTLKSLEQLVDTRLQLQDSKQKEISTWNESKKMKRKIEELEIVMDEKGKAVEEINLELNMMREKVIEEIEKRAELQESKDALQDELEELTKGLFEEANQIVSTEARRGHHHQLRVKNLEQELQEMRLQLQMEQLQLRELKIKMDETSKSKGGRAKGGGDVTKSPGLPPKASLPMRPDGTMPLADDTIDPMLFAEFEDFMAQSPTVKLNKLHNIPFMKVAKDDDVNACLRFGGNSRIYTNMLIDAVVMNSCFVEEMSPAQIATVNHDPSAVSLEGSGNPTGSGSPALPVRRKTLGDLDVKRTSTPTQAIFQRSVMERFSWTSLSSGAVTSALAAASSTNPTVAASVSGPEAVGTPGAAPPLPSCSACGRSVYLRFHFRISEQPDDAWCPICTSCRDRIVAVCEFYNFVRHIRQGLYSTRRREDLFLEVMALKRKMFYARVGAGSLAGQNERPFGRSRGMIRPDSQLLRDLNAKDAEGAPHGGISSSMTARTSISAQFYRFLNGDSSSSIVASDAAPATAIAATTGTTATTDRSEDPSKKIPSPIANPSTAVYLPSLMRLA